MDPTDEARDPDAVIEITRRWIASVVIGLRLCPFAQRVFEAGLIRYVLSEAEQPKTLLVDLTRELQTLAAAPTSTIETTLLIHPRALGDFLEYNDFLAKADQAIDHLGFRGIIQIASFHPDYQFADTDPGAVENFTNRSPYPMLHLLREESISSVAGDPDELAAIPPRNIETLRGVGKTKMLERLRAVKNVSGGPPASRA